MTAALFAGLAVKRLPLALQERVRGKLKLLDGAAGLADLRAVPGNRLELLIGDCKGQYSVRVDDQWRLCFSFENNTVWQAELVDYH